MLQELQRWYLAHCDGEWEHRYGISIDTLDNPGWRLRVGLTGTELETRDFTPSEDTTSEHDWMHCTVEERVFVAHCGPLMLDTAIGHFLEWARPSTGNA